MLEYLKIKIKEYVGDDMVVKLRRLYIRLNDTDGWYFVKLK